MKRLAPFGMCVLVGLGLAACGDVDGGPALARVTNLIAYAPLSGVVEVEAAAEMPAGVKKVELFVAGVGEAVAVAKKAPFALSWDTTGVGDGVHRVALRVTGQDGKVENGEPVEVVVLNHGAQADVFDYEDNAGYVIEIPADYNGTQEVDAPHHWLNPVGVRTILAVAGWTVPEGQAPWSIGLTIGKGICPHRGVQYGDEIYAAESPVVLSLDASAENSNWTVFPETVDPQNAATDWYFIHLRPETATRTAHLGQSVPYWLKVFLLE